MGIICKIIDDKKRKSKKTKTEEENTKTKKKETISIEPIEYGTPEELQGIIDSLLARKKYFENICGELNLQNDDNVKPSSIEEYQLIINKANKEVEELEKIYNLWENKNIEIQFFYEQQLYKTNVNRETKLGDAFKNAVLNEKLKGVRYTNNMDRETGITDENFRNNQQFNYEQMQFSFEGGIITEYFKKNKPVPSLFKDPNNSITPILVHTPLSTTIMGNTYYNQ